MPLACSLDINYANNRGNNVYISRIPSGDSRQEMTLECCFGVNCTINWGNDVNISNN